MKTCIHGTPIVNFCHNCPTARIMEPLPFQGHFELEKENEACPCLHTVPCHSNCTCVNSGSSSGCYRCCSYGGVEQQKARAQELANLFNENAKFRAAFKQIAEWDMLNPPEPMSDFLWLKRLIEELNKETNK